MYCPYCGIETDSKPSKEHIIPYAIGGSNALAINTCRACNNDLGSRVDAPFIEFLPIQSKRFFLGLESTSGNAPSLDLGGTGQVDGREVAFSYRITQEGKDLAISRPQIIKSTDEDGREQWQVFGDPRKVREILIGVIRKYASLGKTVNLNDGTVLTETNLDQVLGPAQRTTEKPSILKKITFDLRAPIRFFSKVALGMGHFYLGESFSRSPHAAGLRGDMQEADLQRLRTGNTAIWPNTESVQGVLQLFARESHHIIAILDGSPPVMVTVLFGDFGAIIPLGATGTNQGFDLSGDGQIWRIELPSRRLGKLSFYEWLAEQTVERPRNN